MDQVEFDLGMPSQVKPKLDETEIEIISRDRVRDAGEVFTPLKIVNQMHLLLPDSDWSDNEMDYLEPTCGNGQFVIKAIEKKIEHGLTIEDAVATTWGMDIAKDNIAQCQARIYNLIKYYILAEDGIIINSETYWTRVCLIVAIVRNNIFHVQLEKGGSLEYIESGKFHEKKRFFELTKKQQQSELDKIKHNLTIVNKSITKNQISGLEVFL